ncbi:ABC transporter permease [Comamonas serinivorans]|uniref:ABC transporter permease n=1 Tax=Comamonas serinivorans TaxID=1082851 RepID=A0A1Y0EIU8_9BURK|nr:ABC transporter substrate-binding protein [Comamonas serinivorans]ARU03564.1 ABC transporter permease [Comamonas serinivorans]
MAFASLRTLPSWRWTGLTGLLGLALGAAPVQAAGISGDVVRIGVLTDLSGQYADTSGKNTIEAVKMAIEDFGGQVKGKKIEVVTADHLNKADVGATKARTWFDRDGVDTIVDLNNTAVSLAVYNLAKERNKLILNTAAASDVLTNEHCIPTAIHYTFDTYAFASGAVHGLAAQGKKNWYVLAVDYAFGKTAAETITKVVGESGGKVVGRTYHPLGASDFSSFMLPAQQSKADVVTFANAGADTVNAIKTAAEFGVSPKQTVVPQIMFISDVKALGLQKAQGLVFATAFYWDRTPETRAWAERFFKRTKVMPTMSHAGAYSAITQYLKAVDATGSDDDGAVLAAHLKRTPINDMFAQNGQVRADGRMVHDMYLVQVKTPAESKREWDYYKVLNTIPGDKAFRPLAESKCPLVKQAS